MKEWEIWSEGYRATGEQGTAVLMGKEYGDTFDDAVKAFALHYKGTKIEMFQPHNFMSDEYYQNRRSNWHCWGCALFDNEADARKTFG